MARRYIPGFTLLNEHKHTRIYPVGSAVAVDRGDILIITSGYVALATTLKIAANTVIGVSNSKNSAADAVSNGTVNAEVLPLLPEYQFMVPCEATGLIAQTDVGTLRNIESEDGLDEGDLVTLGTAFFVDEIDVSSAALAASATFGFAIGHFDYVAAS